MPSKRNIYDLTRTELSAMLAIMGHARFRADQLFNWLYVQKVSSPRLMSNLPDSLIKLLDQQFEFNLPGIAQKLTANDKTVKYRLELNDSASVECVMMPSLSQTEQKRGVSMCLSSQVGCALRCKFCATGTMGRIRDLTPGEIAGQVLVMLNDLPYEPTTVNVLYMGMGEPLLNLENTLKSLQLLGDSKGLQIPMKRITVSTAGIPDGINSLFAMDDPPRLAISLHAANQAHRERLMPISRKFSLETVLDSVKKLSLAKRERVTMEYILLKNENDRPEHARELAELLRKLPVKVNLIPHNRWDGVPYEQPDEDDIEQFLQILTAGGVSATVRRSRGRDAEAACGQLAVKSDKASSMIE